MIRPVRTSCPKTHGNTTHGSVSWPSGFLKRTRPPRCWPESTIMTQRDDNELVLDGQLIAELRLVDQFLENAEPEIAGLFTRERGDKPLLLGDLIQPLIDVLLDKKRKPEQRAAAVSHLHGLLNSLCHPPGPGQPIAAKFHAVLPKLNQASNDGSDLVRQQAILALGSFLAVSPVQEILPTLISTLTSDKRPAGVILAAPYKPSSMWRRCGVGIGQRTGGSSPPWGCTSSR